MASTFNLLSALLLVLFISNEGLAQQCTTKDLAITQTNTGGAVEEKPVFKVVIVSNCSRCGITNLILGCLGFSTVKEVDPAVFKELGGGKCLVNSGNPILAGDARAVSFEYAWATPTDLTVSEFSLDCPK